MVLSQDLCYPIVDLLLIVEKYDAYYIAFQYFNFVMSIVICLVGLVGNAIVIFFIGFVMKNHKSKYWFLNLAIADAFCILTLPLHATATLEGSWTMGPHVCKLFLFSLCTNMYASVFILIALNIARVLSVAKPMFHLKFMSRRVSFWICSFIWIFTILSCIPVFYFGGEVKIGDFVICSYMNTETFDIRYNISSGNATGDILYSEIYTKFNPLFQQCSSDTCCGGQMALDLWSHMLFTAEKFVIPFIIMGYFLPLGIVIVCNVTIAIQVRESKTINTHRIYRIVLIIIAVFFITWTPVVISETVLFTAIVNRDLVAMLNVFLYMPLFVNIAYTNCCLNPILYVLSGGQMRMGLSDFISSIRSSNT
ncbi:hypothetical protein GDO81_016743 [Engystomops pustulosus]|uniref:G-protein coupled receptors family 1 profile domain-containing protein n=1 Tax=Engystomops pustulosus TaxID=76066 RepID=A0AAV7ACI2_ENGPU|nr:hypothetical protein GDO81_016743 [Engystomops pustulosus]